MFFGQPTKSAECDVILFVRKVSFCDKKDMRSCRDIVDIKRERERERERERDRERQGDREKDREREREIGRDRETERDR